jgi:hypothetical protein
MANALNAYKSSQSNLLRNAYKQNIQNLRLQLNIAITKIKNSSVTFDVKQQLILQSKQLFTANQTKLNQLLNENIKNVWGLTQIPGPVPNPVPTPIPEPIPTTNKKALLIGINYIGTGNQLNGCINDVTDVSTFLVGKGFTIKKITDLTSQKPTRSTILSEFKNLLQNSIPGDVLYFMFSGHGSTQTDTNNNEASGKDQLILPLDLQPIVDDELKSIINMYLQSGVKLIALFDSCYSGTVLDLKCQYFDSLNYDAATINDKENQTNGQVFMISGCTDKQTSADAYINNKYNGALTWSYLETLKTSSTIRTWRELVKTMRDKLNSNKYSQIPQFSCGQPTNIDETISWV